jgi:uncharacterized protein YjiS (DUF1127 family)
MACTQRVCSQPIDTSVQRPGPERVWSIVGFWRRMLERSRQRQDLLTLDDHLLADIGLSRREAEREARKWSWQ